MKEINKPRLFMACSIALVVTALTFAIRANLLGVLSQRFSLSPVEIGQVSSAAFWGFTIAMFIGGPICDVIGIGRMFLLAFIAHLAGILMTIYAVNYLTLFFSTLLIGFGNGFVESASYAMVSSMYVGQKAKKINDWHIWFPAGIVMGGLIAYVLTLLKARWEIQMIVMIIPTITYGLMFYKQKFPRSERIINGVSNKEMVNECFRPLFLFMIVCMLLTAATELGTNQWIAELLSTVGVPSILLLVFINGIMTIGRANAGQILERFSTTGLLLFSAIFSFIGLLWLSFATGYLSFAAAGIFAIGVCFFWPTMIGFVSENLPKTGPLGMSLMGGMGLLSTSLILPVFGMVYEHQLAKSGIPFLNQVISPGVENTFHLARVKLNAGSVTLRYVSILPALLVIGFLSLHLKRRRKTKRLNDEILMTPF